MPYENQYIELCRTHPHILLENDTIVKHKGKWSEYFGNHHPLVLEIGTGMGNYFSYMLQTYQDTNFIGLELRYKRLYSTARKATEQVSEKNNFVLIQEYGQKVKEIFAPEEIDQCYIYFPDPYYNKLKHKKHQLLSKQFLQDIAVCTKAGGELHFKTDHREYFQDTLQKVEEVSEWEIRFVTYDYKKSEIYKREAITEFEGLFRGEQEDFYYLILEKK